MTERNRAWRRRQLRRVLSKIQHSHLWVWNQLFVSKDTLQPTSGHMVNPKKPQLHKLHGTIQAVRESNRANVDLGEVA